tara:strand:+ start:177 stop:413 length:237 start_codon:yes stop_codon:yes gene_type:complete
MAHINSMYEIIIKVINTPLDDFKEMSKKLEPVFKELGLELKFASKTDPGKHYEEYRNEFWQKGIQDVDESLWKVNKKV